MYYADLWTRHLPILYCSMLSSKLNLNSVFIRSIFHLQLCGLRWRFPPRISIINFKWNKKHSEMLFFKDLCVILLPYNHVAFFMYSEQSPNIHSCSCLMSVQKILLFLFDMYQSVWLLWPICQILSLSNSPSLFSFAGVFYY